jgi:rhodanese-related sulfurtransferase
MNKIFVFVLALTFLSSSACTDTSEPGKPEKSEQTTTPAKNQDYAPKDFQAHLKDPNIIILDVRTPQEVAQGYIEGAVNINWNSADFSAQVDKMDKSKEVYVYCAVGGRSSQAKSVLIKQGFKEVHNLLGGMDAWQKQGLAVKK